MSSLSSCLTTSPCRESMYPVPSTQLKKNILQNAGLVNAFEYRLGWFMEYLCGPLWYLSRWRNLEYFPREGIFKLKNICVLVLLHKRKARTRRARTSLSLAWTRERERLDVLALLVLGNWDVLAILVLGNLPFSQEMLLVMILIQQNKKRQECCLIICSRIKAKVEELLVVVYSHFYYQAIKQEPNRRPMH